MNDCRVVVTGIGLITPVGLNVAQSWHALCNGLSGITLQNRFVVDNYPAHVAGFVKEPDGFFDTVIIKKNQHKMDRFTQLALMAGDEALRDAGITPSLPTDRLRIGCYAGVGFGGLSSLSESIKQYLEGGAHKVSPFSIPKSISNMAASWLCMHADLQGPVLAVTNACTSGSDAIGLAYRQIKNGVVDYMLAGGTESCVTPVAIASFGNMRTLSTWQHDPAHASRPFSQDRTGFVIAEGAGFMVLEREDCALRRGAHIYAELIGYGAAADAYHMVAMHPDGRGAVQALRAVFADADITADQVDYINAHGTGTQMNDLIETEVIKKIFGIHAQQGLLVSSTKSMTGHMLGAAGGVEAVITALAIHNSIVPPTINLDNPDPVCNLDYVAHHARHMPVRIALSQSFGFGGGCGVLAFKRYQ